MNTHTTTSFWKQQVSLPIAIAAIVITISGSLAAFEHQTGFSASIRSNPVYGSLPVHSAATVPTAVIRRSASTSSVSVKTPNALKRLRARARQHQAAARTSKSR